LQACSHTRNTLNALQHKQEPTAVISDNNVAVGLCNDNLKIKRSKAIDLRFHWIRDRIRQGQFIISWAPGTENRADFFTKALPVHVHEARMHHFVDVPARMDLPSVSPPSALCASALLKSLNA